MRGQGLAEQRVGIRDDLARLPCCQTGVDNGSGGLLNTQMGLAISS
jgi:hypothetical protein